VSSMGEKLVSITLIDEFFVKHRGGTAQRIQPTPAEVPADNVAPICHLRVTL
jgi:hypothetical protein